MVIVLIKTPPGRTVTQWVTSQWLSHRNTFVAATFALIMVDAWYGTW